MGTRNLTCVIMNGEYKVAQYGQWDGYPEGAGVTILDFLTNKMNKELFKIKISQITWITEKEHQERWVESGAEPNSEYVSMEVSAKHKKLYPENSRDTGSDILELIQNTNREIKLGDSINFAKDSLFCEWGYVIDLDKNIFEVYEGFNKNLLTKEDRFYYMQDEKEEYYPIKLVVSFSLDSLPTKDEFLKTFITNEDDEEDSPLF